MKDSNILSLMEPVLHKAGYSTRYLKDGQLLVTNGDMHFTVDLHAASSDSSFNHICLEHRFTNQLAEALFDSGALLVTNKLSGMNPEFNIACSTDGRIRIRYCCDIIQPEDILHHIAYATEHFIKLKEEATQSIVKMYNNIHGTNKVNVTDNQPHTEHLNWKEKLTMFMNQFRQESPTSKAKIIGSAIALVLLTIHLFVFYCSSTYTVFFRSINSSDGIFRQCLNLATFSEAWANGIGTELFIIGVALAFLTLGVLVQLKSVSQSWKALCMLIIFLFNCILALILVGSSLESHLISEVWDIRTLVQIISTSDFWIVFACGFVAHVVWIKLCHESGIIIMKVVDKFSK